MLRRTGYLAIIAALLVTGTLPVAWAATSRIQQARVRKVKACVLRIPSMGEPQPFGGPPNPFYSAMNPPQADPDATNTVRSAARNQLIFYVLDRRTDVKPDGWEFTNPAASPYAGREHSLRFGIAQGTALKSSMPAYWEVELNQANFSILSEMDVIYVPICRRDPTDLTPPETAVPTFLTEEQRRVLTRLADAGVTIWTDWAMIAPTLGGSLGGNEQTASPLTRNKNPYFTNLDFATAAGALAANPTVGHPLISNPFVFQPGEAQQVGSPWSTTNTAPSFERAVETRAIDMQGSCNFAAVVPVQGVPGENGGYIVAGRFGAGYVVATAGNVGNAIAGSFTPAGVIDPNGAQIEDLKFAYNLCAWGTEVTAQQKNGRHTAQNGVQVNGMIEQWTYPNLVRQASGVFENYPPRATALNTLPVNPVPPLIVDGVIISYNRWLNGAVVQSELNAIEQRGEDDFDGNSFIDDPITASDGASHPFADFSLGQGYDRMMGLPIAGTIYGMALGEVPELGTPQGAKAYVLAAGSTGLISLPAPRPGLPAADYWNNAGVAKVAPNVGVAYTGAPGFTILPGNGAYTRAQVYAGGVVSSQPIFGSSLNGKVVAFDIGPGGAFGVAPTSGPFNATTAAWYYPPEQESNRLGLLSGPTVATRLVDEGTGSVDTMVLVTSCSSGDTSGAQGRSGAGDTTGKVEGFIVATQSEVLTYPRSLNQPGANNPNAGRRFVAARWLDIPAGQGQVPQARELIWDASKHYEVRVMDKARNYVLARYVPGTAGFNLLPDGTAGQVELPAPPAVWALPGQPGSWDLSKVVLLADYSVLPQPVDTAGQTIRPRFSPPTPYVRGAQQVVQPTGIGGGVAVGTDNRVYYGTGIGYMCSVEWNRGRAQFAWKMRGLGGDYQDGTGRSTNVDATTAGVAGGYLSDYAFATAPAAGKRVVFASRRSGTVYVMESDATISFKLIPTASDIANGFFPLNAQKAQEVMVAADHGIGFNPNSPFVRATQQPWGRVPNQFAVDPDTSTVTFQNMENFSLDLGAVVSAETLLQSGIDTGGKPAVPIQWRFVGDPNVAANNRTAWVPLPVVAVYRPTGAGAEQWLSGPVIAGDRIYIMGSTGVMHEFPLDPKTLDPAFPRRRDASNAIVTGLNGFNVGNTALYPPVGLVKTRNIAVGNGMPASVASPAIGDRVVAVCTPRGLSTYSAPNVLVADSNRVIEATGDATAVASTDVVVKHRINLSDFAIPTDPPNTNITLAGNLQPILTERQFLNRPAVVRKLGRNGSLTSIFASADTNVPPVDGPTGIQQASLADESYLAADTGNNRVVEFNPGGKVVGEWATFNDPFTLLPSGEPLKLSGPQDVQRWVEMEQVGTGPMAVDIYVIHTLIADTGNTRVIELVDKVQYQSGNFTSGSYVSGLPGQVAADGQPIRWYHVLVWSTQTNAQGLKLRYRNAQRVYWPDQNGNLIGVPTTAATPRAASPSPPFLPDERFLSYTMATVAGHTLSYPNAGMTGSGYFVNHGASPPPGVIDRIPTARSGGDSIVFLRGRYKMDETTAMGPVPVTASAMTAVFGIREAKPGAPTVDRYRFAQGVVDPNLPIISEIRDELISGAIQPPNLPVHRLNGVSSIQRTIRSDMKFAPETWGPSPPARYPYFLIADADGVWECRMIPGNPQFQLTMAFTNEDYAYVTGAGNGAPAQLYSTAGTDHTPGGRRLSAASARRLPNGLILVASRTPSNDQPSSVSNAFHHWRVGADVFLLRSSHYMTAAERQAAGVAPSYSRQNVATHGWQPDLWVQTQFAAAIPPRLQGTPSIRWRASEQADLRLPPTLRTQFGSPTSGNPNDLFGSYQPSQPAYADMVY